MSTRHFLALDIANRQETDIFVIADTLCAAVEECKQLNTEPYSDEAVMLLTAYLTLVTSADYALYKSYTKLMNACMKEVQYDISSIPTKERLN